MAHPTGNLALTVDRFFDLLFPASAKNMAVAVSGGADSFALLHLAKNWAAQKKVALTALTVDHRLRAGSAAEAEIVAHWCRDNAIIHHTLVWEGEKPATALQDKARKARRKLLCGYCSDNAIPVLLLGHQADDQAETILMRLQRGSGLHGLTGMRAQSTDKATGVRIIRPLLTLRRAALRQYALDQALPFIDDPSNEEMKFERVRIRKALTHLPQLGDGIARAVGRLHHAHRALSVLTRQWLEENRQRTADNQFWLPHHAFSTLPYAMRLEAIKKTLHPLGAEKLPLDGLERLVRAMNKQNFAGQTLAECHIRPKVISKMPGYLFEPAPPRQK